MTRKTRTITNRSASLREALFSQFEIKYIFMLPLKEMENARKGKKAREKDS